MSRRKRTDTRKPSITVIVRVTRTAPSCSVKSKAWKTLPKSGSWAAPFYGYRLISSPCGLYNTAASGSLLFQILNGNLQLNPVSPMPDQTLRMAMEPVSVAGRLVAVGIAVCVAVGRVGVEVRVPVGGRVIVGREVALGKVGNGVNVSWPKLNSTVGVNLIPAPGIT